MTAKMQHCFNCGAELGVFDAYHRDLQTCGEKECERAARDMERGEQEEAQYRAQEDNYERYR
jgi:ribosomal protein S27AE